MLGRGLAMGCDSLRRPTFLDFSLFPLRCLIGWHWWVRSLDRRRGQRSPGSDCQVTLCWDGRGAGGQKRPSLGICVCARVTPTSLQEQKKVDAYSADISNMEGARAGKPGGCLVPLSVCSASNKQQSLPKSYQVESEINHALNIHNYSASLAVQPLICHYDAFVSLKNDSCSSCVNSL